MTSTIRVLLVEDHPLFRDGLALALASCEDIGVVGETGTVSEAVSAADRLRPDVVIMDLQLPDGSGSDATREILNAVPSTRVLVLSMSEDAAALVSAVRNGASGYLVKGVDRASIVAAVRSVARGEATFGGEVAAQVLSMLAAETAPREPFPELSERERTVLRLVEDGLTNDAIAERLGIAPKTARNHVSSTLLKLGASDRRHAAEIARNRRADAAPPG